MKKQQQLSRSLTTVALREKLSNLSREHTAAQILVKQHKSEKAKAVAQALERAEKARSAATEKRIARERDEAIARERERLTKNHFADVEKLRAAHSKALEAKKRSIDAMEARLQKRKDALDEMKVAGTKKERLANKRAGKDFAQLQQAKVEKAKLVEELEASRRNHRDAETRIIALESQVSDFEEELQAQSEGYTEHVARLDASLRSGQGDDVKQQYEMFERESVRSSGSAPNYHRHHASEEKYVNRIQAIVSERDTARRELEKAMAERTELENTLAQTERKMRNAVAEQVANEVQVFESKMVAIEQAKAETKESHASEMHALREKHQANHLEVVEALHRMEVEHEQVLLNLHTELEKEREKERGAEKVAEDASNAQRHSQEVNLQIAQDEAAALREQVKALRRSLHEEKTMRRNYEMEKTMRKSFEMEQKANEIVLESKEELSRLRHREAPRGGEVTATATATNKKNIVLATHTSTPMPTHRDAQSSRGSGSTGSSHNRLTDDVKPKTKLKNRTISTKKEETVKVLVPVVEQIHFPSSNRNSSWASASSTAGTSSSPSDTVRSNRMTPSRPPPRVPSGTQRIAGDDWYNRAPTSSDPIPDLMARMESLSADRVSPVRFANDPFSAESKLSPTAAVQTPQRIGSIGAPRSVVRGRRQLSSDSRSIFSPSDPFDYQ